MVSQFLKIDWPIPNLICFYQLTEAEAFHSFHRTNSSFPHPFISVVNIILD